MSKYLITGGLGVIGSGIAKRWASQGHKIIACDNGTEPRNRWIESHTSTALALTLSQCVISR